MGRVPYVDADDLEPPYRELITSSLQPGKQVNVYRAIGNNPDVLDGLRSFLGELWSASGLDDYRRELVILAVAREVDSAYEWHQHVRIARDAGISDEEILAIADGDFDALGADDRRIVEYALAVVANAVDDEIHESIAGQYDGSTVVGIAALANGYAMLAGLIDALGVEIEDSFVGWHPTG